METDVLAGSVSFVSELGFNEIEKCSENKTEVACRALFCPWCLLQGLEEADSQEVLATNEGASGFVKSSDTENVPLGFIRKEVPENDGRKLQREDRRKPETWRHT